MLNWKERLGDRMCSFLSRCLDGNGLNKFVTTSCPEHHAVLVDDCRQFFLRLHGGLREAGVYAILGGGNRFLSIIHQPVLHAGIGESARHSR